MLFYGQKLKKEYVKEVRSFDQVDLTRQEDKDIYSLNVLWKRYVNGEPLPALAVREGFYTSDLDTSLDKTDQMLLFDDLQTELKEKAGKRKVVKPVVSEPIGEPAGA